MKKLARSAAALIIVIAVAGCSSATQKTRYIPPSKISSGVELAKWIPPVP